MAKRIVKKIFKQLRNNILTGVLLIIPLFVTFIIIAKLFLWVDSALPGVIGVEWAPGFGILAILVIAYFAGLAAKNYFGKKLIEIGNAIIGSIPILNKLYLAVQQIVDAFSLQNKKLFERAVLIEFPKANCFSIAFVTSENNQDFSTRIGQKMLAVFVPTTPNPTSGYLLYFPENDVIDLNIPVEAAIKLVMSAGMLSAEQIGKATAGSGNKKASLKDLNIGKLFKRNQTRAKM